MLIRTGMIRGGTSQIMIAHIFYLMPESLEVPLSWGVGVATADGGVLLRKAGLTAPVLLPICGGSRRRAAPRPAYLAALTFGRRTG